MTSANPPPPPRQPIFNLPAATEALLAVNIAVWAVLLVLPESGDDAVIMRFGFTPALYRVSGLGWGLGWQTIVDPVTYQFLHAGLTHLAVNMLGLVAFGAGVERRLGGWRYVVFNLLCGIAGAFTELAVSPGSSDVVIGASAAVSGLFGAILRLAVFRRGFWVLVALWLVMNAVAGITGVGAEGEPVAWIAHVGGFVAGLLLYPLFVRREFRGK